MQNILFWLSVLIMTVFIAVILVNLPIIGSFFAVIFATIIIGAVRNSRKVDEIEKEVRSS